jgi:hypothetical protein
VAAATSMAGNSGRSHGRAAAILYIGSHLTGAVPARR